MAVTPYVAGGNGSGMTPGGLVLPGGMGGAPELTEEQADQLKQVMAGKQGPTTRQQSSLLVQWDRILNIIGPNPFDNTRLSYDQMYQMRKDGVIAFGLHTLEVPIVRAEWYVKCKRPDVASFVDNSMRAIYPRMVLGMLNSLRFGHSPLVKRFGLERPDWTYIDPNEAGSEEMPVWDNGPVEALVWKPFVPLAPEKCWPKWTIDGEFAGIRYAGNIRLPGAMNSGEPSDGPSQTDIDLQHSLWVVNEQDAHFDAIWGYPRTGYAWKPYWAYEYLWALANRFFEKHADPPMVGYHPDGYVDEGGTVVHRADRMLNILASARSGSNIALPSDMVTSEFANTERMSVRREWEIEQLKPEGNPQWFTDRFTALNIEKLRGLWIAEQSVIPGESGQSSRNVAATLNEGVDDSAAFLCMLLDHTINRYVIPDLVRLNFPDFDGECVKVTRGFAAEDVELARQIVQVFGQQDPMSLHVDMDELLKTFGIPMLTGKALEERMNQYVEEAQKLHPPMVPPEGEEGGVAPTYGDGGGMAGSQNGKELAAALESGDLTMKYVKGRERIYLSDEPATPEVIYCTELPIAAEPGISACYFEDKVYALDSVPPATAFKYASMFPSGGISLAVDSLRKASEPRPFSTSKTSNWVARTGGLPPYIQHISHALVKNGHSESNAIQMAIGIVRNWASGQGKVDDNTRAAASKAVAEWEKKRAESKAKHAASAASSKG